MGVQLPVADGTICREGYLRGVWPAPTGVGIGLSGRSPAMYLPADSRSCAPILHVFLASRNPDGFRREHERIARAGRPHLNPGGRARRTSVRTPGEDARPLEGASNLGDTPSPRRYGNFGKMSGQEAT